MVFWLLLTREDFSQFRSPLSARKVGSDDSGIGAFSGLREHGNEVVLTEH